MGASHSCPPVAARAAVCSHRVQPVVIAATAASTGYVVEARRLPCLLCAMALTCCARVTCWCRRRRACGQLVSSAAFVLDALGDRRPSLPSRHSVFLLVSVALALACLQEAATGATKAPWRYDRGVSRHLRLPLADVLPSVLTVSRGCVRVQVDAGGSWKDDGDDGAHAFSPSLPSAAVVRDVCWCGCWCRRIWGRSSSGGGGLGGGHDVQHQWRWS